MITVYSKPNCMQCMFTKKFLDENNIEYKLIDVTQDDAALELIKEHKHLGVPVVSINNFAVSWSGFQPDRLEELKEVAE